MKYLSLLLILTFSLTATCEKSTFIKGEYIKGYEKPFQLTWEVKKITNTSYSFFLNNIKKATIHFDKNMKILKIEKFIKYNNNVKILIMKNNLSINFELNNSLIPFAPLINSISNKNTLKRTQIQTLHKFTIMETIK